MYRQRFERQRLPQVLAPKWIVVQAWFRACRFEDSQGLQCLGLMARCFAAAPQHFHQHAPDKLWWQRKEL